ncbi:cofilin [Aspergillus pseudonomiae]|nr:cofilin [Aspergillus pseudonomiae]
MASGLPLSSECLEAYNALKLKKSFKYVIYGVDSTFKEIVVLKTSSASDYDEFMADLPDDECRWAVYDFAYKRSDGSERNKLVFISWLPDCAKIRHKMIYSSSKDTLRKALTGVAVDISATARDEVSYDAVLGKVNRE